MSVPRVDLFGHDGDVTPLGVDFAPHRRRTRRRPIRPVDDRPPWSDGRSAVLYRAYGTEASAGAPSQRWKRWAILGPSLRDSRTRAMHPALLTSPGLQTPGLKQFFDVAWTLRRRIVRRGYPSADEKGVGAGVCVA